MRCPSIRETARQSQHAAAFAQTALCCTAEREAPSTPHAHAHALQWLCRSVQGMDRSVTSISTQTDTHNLCLPTMRAATSAASTHIYAC